MTLETYYIFEGVSNDVYTFISDSIDTDEEANEYLTEDEDYISWTKETVNPNHYFKTVSFFNDMTDFDDEDGYCEMEFNSEEHADVYMESNDSGGHHQHIRTEEWEDGVLVETKIHSTVDGYLPKSIVKITED